MESGALKRGRLLVALLSGIGLAGCATPVKPLYYWGDYQPELYSYFKGDGQSPEQQIIGMQQIEEKARAQGQALPPGFRAHLGLLYVKTGKLSQAQQAFVAEEAAFPESKPYMDFLLRNFNK